MGIPIVNIFFWMTFVVLPHSLKNDPNLINIGRIVQNWLMYLGKKLEKIGGHSSPARWRQSSLDILES